MTTERKLSGHKIWLIGAGLVLVLVLLLVLGRSGQQQEPAEVPSGRVEITADAPAEIAAGQWQPLDLGIAPTSFEPRQAGYWNFTAYNPESGQQQEVTKNLEPGQGQMIGFEFANSWPSARPAADRAGTAGSAWAEDGVLGGVSRGGSLHRSGSLADPFEPLSDRLAASVVWRNGQTYLHLDEAGILTFVSPAGGWTVEGVELLAGDQNGAGWMETNGSIWLWDWSGNRQPAAEIGGSGASAMFVGQEKLYLFKRHELDDGGGADHSHPDGHGYLEIYDRGGGPARGRVDVLAQPIAMAEAGRHSFWQISGELYVIDNNRAAIDESWGFSRELVDLLSGPGPSGQPLIYLLTDEGEIWDFDPRRQTYNLASRAVGADHQPGRAVFGSLAQDGDYLYFGFLWGDLFENEQTFRVRLGEP